MKTKAICHALCASAVLLTLPLHAQNARLPYAQLYQMQRAQSELSAAYTNLVVVLRMKPASTNAITGDLDVYIDAKSGRIPVKIGPAGDFSVPMGDDLLGENPWIITNRPRGSMKLDWFVGLVVRQVPSSIRYRALMQVVRDCGDVRERMRQVFPGSPKATVSGLKLTFSPGGQGAAAVIHSERGDRKLEANTKGELTIAVEPSFFDENPLVTLSKEPAGVELVSREDGQ